jgi:hypothetical protein
VFGLKVETGVLWRAAVVVDQVLAEGVLDLDEVGLVVRCREALGYLLEGRREAVIGLIAGGPESVSAGVLRWLDNLEDGVVGGDALEGDVSMPSLAGKPLGFVREPVLVELAVLLR